MAEMMVTFFLVALTFLSLWTCEALSEPTTIGSSCLTHAECTQGPQAIPHSRCLARTCRCIKGYHVNTSNPLQCMKADLGLPCSVVSDPDQFCQDGSSNSHCNLETGYCDCNQNYTSVRNFYWQYYCDRVGTGSPCTPDNVGDTFCKDNLYDQESFCHRTYCTCACPKGELFLYATGTCEPLLTEVDCLKCHQTGGVCYFTGSEIKCECPTSLGSSSLEAGCDIGLAGIGESCSTEGMIYCQDEHSECSFGGQYSGMSYCRCKLGHVPIPGYSNLDRITCYSQISQYNDRNCAQCVARHGLCYDVDGDGVHDGCVCPDSRSTSNPDDPQTYCDTKHVDVSCNATSMKVCYFPHNTDKFLYISERLTEGEASVFIKGRSDDYSCHLVQEGDFWCIDLDFETENRDNCDTTVTSPTKSTVTYQNWLVMQPYKMSVANFVAHCYCTYDILVNTYTGIVEVAGIKDVASEGEQISPDIEMFLQNEFSVDVAYSTVTLGSPIRAIINMTDDKGVYQSIKAETCILSNRPNLDDPSIKAELLLYNGCAESGYKFANFRADAHNLKVLRSAFFPIFSVEDSVNVFLHCAVRVCRNSGSNSPCQPSVCRLAKRSIRFDKSYLESDLHLVRWSRATGVDRLSSAEHELKSSDFEAKMTGIRVVHQDDVDSRHIYREQENPAEMPRHRTIDNERSYNQPHPGDLPHLNPSNRSSSHIYIVVGVLITAIVTFLLIFAAFYFLFIAKRRLTCPAG